MEKNQSNLNEERDDLVDGLANIIRFFAEMSEVRANIGINRENANREMTKFDLMLAIRNFEAEMAQNSAETPVEAPIEDTIEESTQFEKASNCLEQKTQKSDDKNIDGKPF